MDVVVVGAGPTGIVTALLLARSGHPVTVIDSDPGPDESGAWQRSGVYQFHQPHLLRAPAVTHLQQQLPDVFDNLLHAGAETASLPAQPGVIAGLRSRRPTFERVLRAAMLGQHGVTHVSDRVVGIELDGDTVTGVRLHERLIQADLVVDTTGRSGLTTALRNVVEDSTCGFSYVSRAYRLLDGAERGPLNAPPGFAIFRDGYFSIVFVQDNRWFQVLVVRATTDKDLAHLRHEAVWDAVIPTIPAMAAWLDPARCTTMGQPSAGNAGRNSYRHQAHAVTGLLAVGDAVCTTNPMGARGISLGIAGAVALAGILAEHPRQRWAHELDQWCTRQVRPWFDDQVEIDAAMLRRWAGEPLNPSGPLPADLIAATAEADPQIMQAVCQYNLMSTTSAVLDSVRERAREILTSGWRPIIPDSPTHDDLVQRVRVAARAALVSA